jgi:hypothetical protein
VAHKTLLASLLVDVVLQYLLNQSNFKIWAVVSKSNWEGKAGAGERIRKEVDI